MRATFLQFRNPKEQTPDARYPQNTNYGRPVNKYNYANESESKRGTFGSHARFDHGSIYKDVVDRTTVRVGPGAYTDEQVVRALKKKPCMSTFHRPQIADNEVFFEMQGHMRILQKNYFPRSHKEAFETLMDKFKDKLGRKVNDTLVFKKAIIANETQRSEMGELDVTDRLRTRNLSTLSSGDSTPAFQHISRIRTCYQKGLKEREQLCSQRCFSPQ